MADSRLIGSGLTNSGLIKQGPAEHRMQPQGDNNACCNIYYYIDATEDLNPAKGYKKCLT